jgi:predicted signal transduction protein with EAL and GGDEF domain
MLLDRVTCAEEAAVVANRILANMPPRFGPEGQAVAVGISVGIVIADQSVETSEALLNRADQALYHAKRTGKGRFSLYQTVEKGALEGAF